MIQDLYLLYKETGNIKPFYDFVLKLSQIKCRKLGVNYQKEEISTPVAGDLYIAIVTGKVKEDPIDYLKKQGMLQKEKKLEDTLLKKEKTLETT